MVRLDLKTGFSCNNMCSFCVQGDKRYKFKDKNTNELVRLMQIAARRSIRSIVFTGGEPTIREDLIYLVKAAKRLGFSKIQIQSNGRMFAYLNYCKLLVRSGVTEFSPAIHGSTAKLHEALVCSPGSFNEVVRGIKNLVKLKQFVLTNTVITKINYSDLPRIAKLLIKLGVNQYQFAFIHILGSAHKNRLSLVPKKSKIMPFVKRGLDMGRKAGVTAVTEAIPFCFMISYENNIAERNIPDTTVFDANFEISDYAEYRQKEGKVKAVKCKKCHYFKICEGPWKEYIQLFGWEEFIPVIK